MQELVKSNVVCDGNVHVVPDVDYIEHVESSECICCPKLEVIPPNPANGILDVVFYYQHHALSGDILD